MRWGCLGAARGVRAGAWEAVKTGAEKTRLFVQKRHGLGLCVFLHSVDPSIRPANKEGPLSWRMQPMVR